MKMGSKGVALIIALILVGCSATQQARNVKGSGFLGEHYAKLQKGQDGQALYIYKNPRADFGNYRKILLDPVVIWRSADSDLNQISKEDLITLANFFYEALYKNFSKDYEMVKDPEPGTLRIQIAITHVEESSIIFDVASTVIPKARLLSKGKEIFTGKPAFVGEASVEAKFIDAGSGELVGAGIDRRVGGKRLGGITDSWEDVKSSFQYWADKLAWRLCLNRGDKNCQPPEE